MGKIWITGASSGIGKALAIKFANEGWKVAASARREILLKKQISYGNFVRYQPEEVYSKIYNTSVALLDEKPFEMEDKKEVPEEPVTAEPLLHPPGKPECSHYK